MPRLIVYAGPNGSGKSTTRDIAGDPADIVIDPDRIARGLRLANQAMADIESGRETVRLFNQALADGQSVSLETTLTGSSILRRMRQAKAAGFEISLFYVALLDPSRNIARVAARVANGGHHIPSDTIVRRVAASQENLPAALTIADYGKVFDNSGPELTHLLTVEHGRILFEAPALPQWLARRMPSIRQVLGTAQG
jgi:predicted ABC-type ATPase